MALTEIIKCLRQVLILSWAILLSAKSVAQNTTFRSGKWGLEVNYMTGRFLRHGASSVPSDLSHGVELNYYRKTLGEKPWHRGLNYPEIGAALTFYSFADNKVFGNAISLMGYSKLYLVRSRVADFYLRIGGGYGLMTRQYDAVSNPTNTLISTPINMAIQLRLGLEWKLSPYILLNTAVSFNHFSNAGIKLPNYGLNIPSGTLGIKIVPSPHDVSYNCESSKNFKKNELIWKLSAGIMQLHSFNSTTTVPTHIYLTPVFTAAYARYINPANKFYGGLSFEYFPAIRDYIISNDLQTRYGATFEAFIPSVVLGEELKMGRVSMFYSAGAYLWKSTATITPIYFKVGMNVYFAQLRRHKGIGFFFGNNVKAHTNVAQYNEWSIGGTL